MRKIPRKKRNSILVVIKEMQIKIAIAEDQKSIIYNVGNECCHIPMQLQIGMIFLEANLAMRTKGSKMRSRYF